MAVLLKEEVGCSDGYLDARSLPSLTPPPTEGSIRIRPCRKQCWTIMYGEYALCKKELQKH
jgi:hypothetical protein